MIDFSEYIGIPFQAGGRDRCGCDCWGLLRLIYKERLGVDLPAYTGYDRPLGERAAALIQEGRTEWEAVSRPEPMDAVLFKVGGRPNHIGLVVVPGLMIHSATGKDSCIESYNRPLWRSRIEGFYRAR
tara:strand:+ start:3199 stop:3582 length:384 start_codon:yes stop_codon:yes gene_type:complete